MIVVKASNCPNDARVELQLIFMRKGVLKEHGLDKLYKKRHGSVILVLGKQSPSVDS